MNDQTKEAVELLLSNRLFLYSLMHKLFGREPDEELLNILTDEHTGEAFGLLSEKEKSVVLIGCGRFGAAILERALLTNVYTPDRTVHYHVFEDSTGFEKMHTELARALSKGEPGEDSLTFYSDSWMDEIPVIRQADRIILCRNNDQENLDCYERLATWFGVRENVYIYLDEEVPGVLSFGVVGALSIRSRGRISRIS